jgi:DNA invertase Pin-like site-specific DNA recombinase
LETNVNFKDVKIGYARVSTEAQNIEMQIQALEKEGCETVYQEKKSAFDKRPEFDNAIKSLRTGDTLCVWAFDRLGRNMLEVMANVKEIHDKGANVYSIVHKTDTDTPAGKIMLFNFSLFAEMEATLRRERQQAGITIARTQGRALGRRKGMSDETLSKAGLVRQMYLSQEPVYTISQITKEIKYFQKNALQMPRTF